MENEGSLRDKLEGLICRNRERFATIKEKMNLWLFRKIHAMLSVLEITRVTSACHILSGIEKVQLLKMRKKS